jgi:hypothetical protein
MRFVEEDLYINTALSRSIEPKRSSQSLVAFRVGSWPLSAPRWNTTNRQSLRCDSIDTDTYHLSCIFREGGSDGLVEFDSCLHVVLCICMRYGTYRFVCFGCAYVAFLCLSFVITTTLSICYERRDYIYHDLCPLLDRESSIQISFSTGL